MRRPIMTSPPAAARNLGRRYIQVGVNPQVRVSLRLMAVQQEETMANLIRQAIDEFLIRKGVAHEEVDGGH